MIGRASLLFIFHPQGELGEHYSASYVFPICDLVASSKSHLTVLEIIRVRVGVNSRKFCASFVGRDL